MYAGKLAGILISFITSASSDCAPNAFWFEKGFVGDATAAGVIGDELLWHHGEVCGWVMSGGYAHAPGVSIAMAPVPKEWADADDGWQIELIGERLRARLQPTMLFEHNGERVRN